MNVNKNRKSGQRAGFSMIEVLVASTILIVIVMMLGMLFQQTSLAWRIGVKRARGFMQVRAAIGAIQRDASAAVDANEVRRKRRELDPTDTLIPVNDQKFSGSDLEFYTLSGTNRALTKVSYSLGSEVRRTEQILKKAGPRWTLQQVSSVRVVDSSSKTTVQNVNATYATGVSAPAGFPLYITFEAEVKAAGANLDIGAASAGPDKQWDTKDDIKTWVEK